MADAIGVFDASSLIAFTEVGRLELLSQRYATVLVPPAVVAETVRTVVSPEWLVQRSLARPLDARIKAARLGPGESEAIALALEHPGSEVVLDDLRGRRLASSLGLTVVGALGLVLRAKRDGLIEAARPELVALQATGLFLGRRLVEQALLKIGEA